MNTSLHVQDNVNVTKKKKWEKTFQYFFSLFFCFHFMFFRVFLCRFSFTSHANTTCGEIHSYKKRKIESKRTPTMSSQKKVAFVWFLSFYSPFFGFFSTFSFIFLLSHILRIPMNQCWCCNHHVAVFDFETESIGSWEKCFCRVSHFCVALNLSNDGTTKSTCTHPYIHTQINIRRSEREHLDQKNLLLDLILIALIGCRPLFLYFFSISSCFLFFIRSVDANGVVLLLSSMKSFKSFYSHPMANGMNWNERRNFLYIEKHWTKLFCFPYFVWFPFRFCV